MTFIKKVRRRSTLSASELSELSGISRANISALENDLDLLGKERADKIGKVLGIPEDVMTVYRGVLPDYATLAYKLFPDLLEKRIKDIAKKIVQEAINSPQMIGDRLVKVIADNKKFFQWVELSDLAVCGSCEKIVDKKIIKGCVCKNCYDDEEDQSPKVRESDYIEVNAEKMLAKVEALIRSLKFVQKIKEKANVELYRDFSLYGDVESGMDEVFYHSKIDEARELLGSFSYDLCTMCGKIYPLSSFPNMHCQDCNDAIEDKEPSKYAEMLMEAANKGIKNEKISNQKNKGYQGNTENNLIEGNSKSILKENPDHQLCTMCGETHPSSFFPNGYCQNCNDEAGMTKEDLDELNRLAETNPHRSKKDQ